MKLHNAKAVLFAVMLALVAGIGPAASQELVGAPTDTGVYVCVKDAQGVTTCTAGGLQIPCGSYGDGDPQAICHGRVKTLKESIDALPEKDRMKAADEDKVLARTQSLCLNQIQNERNKSVLRALKPKN